MPLTWILLLVIIILTYFFGWMVLLYVFILTVFITLATMVYDFVTRKDPETISFWFTCDKPLEEIGQILEKAGLINDHTVEGENVWEWIEAGSPSAQYGVNISRKHKDYTCPVHIKVLHHDKESTLDLREQLGNQLAKVLKTDIKAGTVEYISGNDFEFREEMFFRYVN